MNVAKAVTAVVMALTLAGCGGMSVRDRDTVVGAGIGAAAGAAVTGNTLGTVGGAAVGGVIGNQVGRH